MKPSSEECILKLFVSLGAYKTGTIQTSIVLYNLYRDVSLTVFGARRKVIRRITVWSTSKLSPPEALFLMV